MSSEARSLLALTLLSVTSVLGAAGVLSDKSGDWYVWLFVFVVSLFQTGYWGWRFWREVQEP